MKKVYKYKKKIQLEQGKVYLFKLYKKIESPDETNYYVMIDPFCNKHLIPVGYYLQYNLEIGKSYLCKVDKINCLGRIFIEPPHPFYKENENYLFEFVKKIEKRHNSGNIYNYYLLKGENTYDAYLDAENFELADNLKSGNNFFQVKKISKGKVFLFQYIQLFFHATRFLYPQLNLIWHTFQA